MYQKIHEFFYCIDNGLQLFVKFHHEERSQETLQQPLVIHIHMTLAIHNHSSMYDTNVELFFMHSQSFITFLISHSLTKGND